MDQQVDQLGPQELNLLVIVIDPLKDLFHPSTGIITFLTIEKGKEQVLYGIDGYDIQTVGIFEIDDPVTDIIGSFYEKNKRMPGKNILLSMQLRDPQLGCDLFIGIDLGIEKSRFLRSQLLLVKPVDGVCRIFHDRGQGGIGQFETAGLLFIKMMREGPEGIGIPLKIQKVLLLVGAELSIEPVPSCSFEPAEESAYRVFSRMPKRRVADIMRQAARGDDG